MLGLEASGKGSAEMDWVEWDQGQNHPGTRVGIRVSVGMACEESGRVRLSLRPSKTKADAMTWLDAC